MPSVFNKLGRVLVNFVIHRGLLTKWRLREVMISFCISLVFDWYVPATRSPVNQTRHENNALLMRITAYSAITANKYR